MNTTKIYVLIKDDVVFNVDNEGDVERLVANGAVKLTDEQIKQYGMFGYERYVSPDTATVAKDGSIVFTRPSDIELNNMEADAVRMERDNLLESTDKYVLPDFQLSEEKIDAVKAYRKALRDIPEQEGFPQNVVWPVKPEL